MSLSGNPHAALVDFHVFYWPLRARTMGCGQFLLERARMGQAFERRGDLVCLLCAMVADSVVTPPERDRHLAHGAYNCIVVLSPGCALAAGQQVETYLMPVRVADGAVLLASRTRKEEPVSVEARGRVLLIGWARGA